MTTRQSQYPDFTTTDAYNSKGWAGYLQTRADAMKHGWAEAPGEKEDDKKFTALKPLYETTFTKAGYSVSETVMRGDNDAFIVKTSYDAWGRKVGHHSGTATGSSMQFFPAPARTLQGSPIEEILETTDTTNYLQFLNVYFQDLKQTMRPFSRPEMYPGPSHLLHELQEIWPPLLGWDDQTTFIPHFRNLDDDVFRSKGCTPDAIQKKIANTESSATTDLLTMLKSGISTYETLRLALCDNRSDIAKKAQDIYGPEKGFFKSKKNQNDAMFKIWKALPDFTPAAKLQPA